MKKIKLFCLPWAGGNAISFNKFKKRLRPDIELHAVEYAGHGTRSSEPLYQDMDEAIDDIYSLLSRSIGDNPYALFGHSMGAEIAYELYHKIADEHMDLPVHMFFSARKAPHVNDGAIRYHALPHDQFKEEITRLNGIPDFVKESDEVFDFLAPVILSDCRLIENHQYQEKQTLISCRITVIYGSSDGMTEGTTGHEWAFHSADQCSVFHVDANHFFIMDKCKEIADIINAAL